MLMNSIPLMFSTVTGLVIAAVGAALASSEIAGWGLFTVGLGILAVAMVARASAAPRPIKLNYAETRGGAHLQQR
jgi:fucose permease